jgi:hypothetical protein
MSRRTAATVFLTVALVTGAGIHLPSPQAGWRFIRGKSASFYAEHGFVFHVADHGGRDSKIEIAIEVPKAFTDSGFGNALDSVAISSTAVSCAIATQETDGHAEAVVLLSRSMVPESELHFRYANSNPSVVTGYCYTLPVSALLDVHALGPSRRASEAAREQKSD